MVVRLIVDVHEGEFLATIAVADERRPLEVGDFLLETDDILTTWVFERKTWGDGLNSWKNKRLQDQIARMVEKYDNYGLIIEGKPDDFFAPNPDDWKHFRIFLNRVCAEVCPVIHTDTVSETTRYLNALKLRITEGKANHFIRPVTMVKSTRNEHHAVLQSLPGIGQKKAKALYDLYPSLRAVFDDWETAKEDGVVVARTWKRVNDFMEAEWEPINGPEPIRVRKRTKQTKLGVLNED